MQLFYCSFCFADGNELGRHGSKPMERAVPEKYPLTIPSVSYEREEHDACWNPPLSSGPLRYRFEIVLNLLNYDTMDD